MNPWKTRATTVAEPTARLTRNVQGHYDRLSGLYRRFWGEHLHHGYWEGDETRTVAQEKLIEKLRAFAGIESGCRILDVGCGLGGSSLWLAAYRAARTVGISISPAQIASARQTARQRGLDDRCRFFVHNAETGRFRDLEPDAPAFDAVWVVECSEHLNDKAAFFGHAAEALRPGGVLAVAAWIDTSRTDEDRRLVAAIQDRMICPGFGRIASYEAWFRYAGLDPTGVEDITLAVTPTWDHCCGLLDRIDVSLLLLLLGRSTRRFVASFPMMRSAFRTGAMAYGLFAARKPCNPPSHPYLVER